MNRNIEELIMGLAGILLIMIALNTFFNLNNSINNYFTKTANNTNHKNISVNENIEVEEEIYGSELIYLILDNKEYEYEIVINNKSYHSILGKEESIHEILKNIDINDFKNVKYKKTIYTDMHNQIKKIKYEKQ